METELSSDVLAPDQQGDPATPPVHILFADKDPMDIIQIKKFLSSKIESYVIHSVRTGVEVFDFLDKKEPYQDAPTPDLIVLLPDLPCLGGYDVAQKLSCSEGYKKIPMMIFNPLRVPEKKHVEVAPELMRVHPFRYLIEAYFRQVQ